MQTLDVTFSEPIDAATLTGEDITLTRNGVVVPLTGLTFTPVGTGGTTFRIAGLQAATTTPGAYVLTVDAAASRTSPATRPPAPRRPASWSRPSDTTAPTISPLPTITVPVQTVDVTFSEAINAATFTSDDLTLTRDGQSVALTGVTVTQVNPTTFRIAGLQGVTTTPGAYVLTVNGAGIQDLAGNAATGTQTASFTVPPVVVGGRRSSTWLGSVSIAS